MRKIVTEEKSSPTITSTISKATRMGLGMGEKKKEKKVYTFK